MDNKIQKIKKIRLFILDQVKELSTAQLNAVPQGFNNNIIWNLGHLIASQQGLCYLRSGQAVAAAEEYVQPFLPGTKPEKNYDAAEIEAIKIKLIELMDQCQADYDRGLFNNYTPSENIKNRYGMEIVSIDSALDFILYHEGLHCGCILSLKKLVV